MKRFLCTVLLFSFCLLSFSSCTQEKDEPVTLACRVIAVIEDELLLASEGHEPIMTLTPAKNPKITLLRDGQPTAEADNPTPGDYLYLTFSGGMLDTLPSVPRGVTQMDIVSAEFDNLAAVYLTVLTDFAKEEELYFDGLSMLAVSLEDTALPAYEQSAIIYAIARQYPSLTVIEESREDLKAKGFMTYSDSYPHWRWDIGAFLAIYEVPKKCTDKKRYFNTSFNRSFGHGWTNCKTARDPETGIWSPYEIGGIILAD